MNTAVSATGMSVKAKTEGGLAIAAYTTETTAPVSTEFASSAAAVFNSNANVFPVSTANATTWYKATATDANSYSATADNHKAIVTTGEGSESLDNYRLISKFQVKSLDVNTDTTNAKLYVTGVSVSGGSTGEGKAVNEALNKSLRVAIKVDSNVYYFAPMYTSALGSSLYYWNGTQRTAYGSESANTIKTNESNAGKLNVQVSTQLSTAVKDIEIYVYYEGEDENCMSINAVNVDTLTVEVTFSTTMLN